jgi:GTP-binding protein Era
MTRCGFVTIVGEPNVGKSSLINHIIGAKVSIVTPKVQTTRGRGRGIYVNNAGNTQIIFTDTAGIFRPKRRLEKAMVKSAYDSAREADLLVFVTAPKYGVNDEVVQSLRQVKAPIVGVITQIDAAPKLKISDTLAQMEKTKLCSPIFLVSSKDGTGVAKLLHYVEKQMPEGPFYFDKDQITDQPNMKFAAEITREKLFLYLRDELPYALTVETTDWRHNDDGSLRVGQTIFVEREAHRKIILGAKGTQIKKVGSSVREDLSKWLETKVHLFLFIKVRQNWLDDQERYANMGLEFKV